MSDDSLLVEFERVGAILTNDHFVYTKDDHGDAYFDKDRIYPHAQLISEVCVAMVEPFIGQDIEAVVAPEKGGIILSTWMAFHLSNLCDREVLGFYAEKAEGGGFVLKRGGVAEFITGKRVLVGEDVLNTGASVHDVVHAVRMAGGIVVGVSAIVNRGGVTKSQVGNPFHFHALLDIPLRKWPEKSCPLCRDNVPINISVGKGKEFLERTRSGP